GLDVPHVAEHHVDGAPLPAPNMAELVCRGTQCLRLGRADLLCKKAANLAPSTVLAVLGIHLADDRVQVDTGELERDHRIHSQADLDLAELRSPLLDESAQLCCYLSGENGNDVDEAEWCQTGCGEVLRRGGARCDRHDQDGLSQPVVSPEWMGALQVPRFCFGKTVLDKQEGAHLVAIEV